MSRGYGGGYGGSPKHDYNQDFSCCKIINIDTNSAGPYGMIIRAKCSCRLRILNDLLYLVMDKLLDKRIGGLVHHSVTDRPHKECTTAIPG